MIFEIVIIVQFVALLYLFFNSNYSSAFFRKQPEVEESPLSKDIRSNSNMSRAIFRYISYAMDQSQYSSLDYCLLKLNIPKDSDYAYCKDAYIFAFNRRNRWFYSHEQCYKDFLNHLNTITQNSSYLVI